MCIMMCVDVLYVPMCGYALCRMMWCHVIMCYVLCVVCYYGLLCMMC